MGEAISNSHRSLTQFEEPALRRDVLNLADAHVRWSPCQFERPVLSAFRLVQRNAFDYATETGEMWEAFLALTSQTMRAVPLTTYSSSVAFDTALTAFRRVGYSEALVQAPVFDNLVDLLRSRGFKIRAIAEDDLGAPGAVGSRISSSTIVVLCSPNNPTGFELKAEDFSRIAQEVRDAGGSLLLDSTFRFAGSGSSVDLEPAISACSHVIVEDTGKLFSTADLKVGGLRYSPDLEAPLRRANSDLLLNVSPHVVDLITGLSRSAANLGGMTEYRERVDANRRLLERSIGDRMVPAPPGLPVALVRFPVDAQECAESLYRTARLQVLPAAGFWWHDPSEAGHLVRVSLARDPDDIAVGGAAMAAFIERSTASSLPGGSP